MPSALDICYAVLVFVPTIFIALIVRRWRKKYQDRREREQAWHVHVRQAAIDARSYAGRLLKGLPDLSAVRTKVTESIRGFEIDHRKKRQGELATVLELLASARQKGDAERRTRGNNPLPECHSVAYYVRITEANGAIAASVLNALERLECLHTQIAHDTIEQFSDDRLAARLAKAGMACAGFDTSLLGMVWYFDVSSERALLRRLRADITHIERRREPSLYHYNPVRLSRVEDRISRFRLQMELLESDHKTIVGARIDIQARIEKVREHCRCHVSVDTAGECKRLADIEETLDDRLAHFRGKRVPRRTAVDAVRRIFAEIERIKTDADQKELNRLSSIVPKRRLSEVGVCSHITESSQRLHHLEDFEGGGREIASPPVQWDAGNVTLLSPVPVNEDELVPGGAPPSPYADGIEVPHRIVSCVRAASTTGYSRRGKENGLLPLKIEKT